MNVLITSVGRRAPLVKAFKEAQRKSNKYFNSKVVCVNIDEFCAGLYVGDKFYTVRSVLDPLYIPEILQICKEDNIDLVVPTIDIELPVFAKISVDLKEDLKRAGITVAISNPETIQVCNDKLKTFSFFMDNKIPTPFTYTGNSRIPNDCYWPVFLKPRHGRGGTGAYKINNRFEYDFYSRNVKDFIIQDFLTGTEFTIDVLCDFEGQVISVVPRTREVIRSGVSDQGRTIGSKLLIDWGSFIASELEIRGPANIQGFMNGDDISFTEVNPRFSGAIPLTIAAGADFPAMLIRMVGGEEVRPCVGEFKDNLTMLRYEQSLFREGMGNHNQRREGR